MKKLTYLLVGLLTVSLGLGLASCGNPGPKPGPTNNNIFKNTNADQHVDVRQGFTSLLANNKQLDVNKPLITEKGKQYYTVAGVKAENQDTYTSVYSTDMDKTQKLNYLTNTYESSAIIYASTLDGLYGNTKSTRLIGNLAIGVKIHTNADGSQDYYFQLRKQVPWVLNGTGELYKVNDQVQFVTAQDFVDGLFVNLTSSNSMTSYIPGFFVKGAKTFAALLQHKQDLGENLTIEQKHRLFRQNVGVEAIGDDVIKYSLTQQVPFFPTMLTYTCFYPVNYHFYAEKGSKFGETYQDILANGPYYLKNYTQQQTIVYERNKYYYDLDHVYIKTITKNYMAPGGAADQVRKLYEAGKIDSFNVVPQDTVGWDKYVGANNPANKPKNPLATPLFTTQGSSIYVWGFNLNRDTTNDDQYKKSIETDKTSRENTAKAIANKNFRLGIFYSMDIKEYNSLGKSKTPSESIYRMLFPQELAFDPISGKDYTTYVEEHYTEKTTGKTNVKPIDLVGSTAEKDPIYDLEKAKKYLKQAKTELAAENVQFPVSLDIQGSSDNDAYKQYRDFFKKLEAKLIDDADKKPYIKTNVIFYQSADEAAESNQNAQYDLSGNIGWGPDYADPLTNFYLTPDSGMLQNFGFLDLDLKDTTSRTYKNYEKYYKDYNDTLAKISKLSTASEIDQRYKEFAKLEYKTVFEDALLMPYFIPHAWTVLVGKLVPYQASKAAYGLNSDKYLNAVVTKQPLTRADKKAAIDNINDLQKTTQEDVKIYDISTGKEIEHFAGLKQLKLTFPKYLRNDFTILNLFGLTTSDNDSIIAGFFYDKAKTDLVENYADDDSLYSVDLSKLQDSKNIIWANVLTKPQREANEFKASLARAFSLKDEDLKKTYLKYFEAKKTAFGQLSKEAQALIPDVLTKIDDYITKINALK